MKWINITKPNREMLIASIRNNIFFYYVALFAWVGFLFYAIAYRDIWLMFDSIMLFMAACYFGIAQKVDKARLESLLDRLE
jgi:hypothetical protein